MPTGILGGRGGAFINPGKNMNKCAVRKGAQGGCVLENTWLYLVYAVFPAPTGKVLSFFSDEQNLISIPYMFLLLEAATPLC